MSQKLLLAAALLFGAGFVFPAAAQVKPTPPSDPLARIRAAAAANAEACTVQPTSPCAQANPKIIAAAQNSTSLDANLHKLLDSDIGARVNGSRELTKAIAWAVAGFKAAGVDDVHTEKYTVPAALVEIPDTVLVHGSDEDENVVAEIRGREKPGEFVVLSSHLDSWGLGGGALDAGCNAALVIEVARAIHLTGLRPLRSIRFILFTNNEQQGNLDLGSWAYVQAHRAELDHIAAAVSFDRGTGRVTGFSLGGRPDLDPAVRETLAEFDSSWGITRYTNDATLDSDNYDFLLEGVPTLLANQEDADYMAVRRSTADVYDKIDLASLKRNTAVAGVLVFGLAERAIPLGPRFSRTDTEALLERTGVATSMRQADMWRLWQDGSRGRQP
jgi:Zn-dependent M28 family amino/carboxypeptidase